MDKDLVRFSRSNSLAGKIACFAQIFEDLPEKFAVDTNVAYAEELDKRRIVACGWAQRIGGIRQVSDFCERSPQIDKLVGIAFLLCVGKVDAREGRSGRVLSSPKLLL